MHEHTHMRVLCVANVWVYVYMGVRVGACVYSSLRGASDYKSQQHGPAGNDTCHQV